MMGRQAHVGHSRAFSRASWDWYSVTWLGLFSFQGLYEGLLPGFD